MEQTLTPGQTADQPDGQAPRGAARMFWPKRPPSCERVACDMCKKVMTCPSCLHQGYHGPRQAQRFQTCKGSEVPGFQGSRVARFSGCGVPRFQGYKAPGIQGCKFQWFENPKISEFRDYRGSRALQGSKVAMSRGKVPSLHHDPTVSKALGLV